MATNFIQDGDELPVTLAANANSGDLILIGSLFGIAETSGSTGDVITIETGGVWSLPKVSGASTLIAIGGAVYFDATNVKVTNSATSNTKVGVCVNTAAANADVTVTVRLNGNF